MAVERREYRFSGRVQGVGFRATARDVASELGLGGYVRNLDDGSVEAVASGPPELLDQFVQRLRSTFGPNLRDVRSWPAPLQEDGDDPDGFEVRF